MQVIIAEKCGFCHGVKTAITLARKTLQNSDSQVYCLGPIIHNNDIVSELAADGLKTVDSVSEIPPNSTVLIRSHGAHPNELRLIQQKGLKIVDATCILVKRVQKIAQSLHHEAYKVVIIGDKNHPEVKALIGYARDVEVVTEPQDLTALQGKHKLGIICQTTQSPDHFKKILADIIKLDFSEIKIINTLCNETIKRQEAAIKLCKKVDIMFVLGGLHSANTRKLAELCKKYNQNTFHLQNWNELDKSILFGKNTAGVTAGASTPDRIINEFVENLRIFDNQSR